MNLLTPEQLLASALRCSPDAINSESALAVHPNWDSFGHMSVMLELEKHYGIEVSDETIRHFETYEAIRQRYDALLRDRRVTL